MKKKGVIFIISGVLIVAIIIVGFIINSNNSKRKSNGTSNIKTTEEKSEGFYEVKNEIKQEPVKEMESLRVEKEFEISDVQQNKDKLIISINSEIEEAKEAYEMAVLIKESIEKMNRDKIVADGVKTFEILLKGENKSWLFDKTESIKEIEFK